MVAELFISGAAASTATALLSTAASVAFSLQAARPRTAAAIRILFM
jgi:hypothetical protein